MGGLSSSQGRVSEFIAILWPPLWRHSRASVLSPLMFVGSQDNQPRTLLAHSLLDMSQQSERRSASLLAIDHPYFYFFGMLSFPSFLIQTSASIPQLALILTYHPQITRSRKQPELNDTTTCQPPKCQDVRIQLVHTIHVTSHEGATMRALGEVIRNNCSASVHASDDDGPFRNSPLEPNIDRPTTSYPPRQLSQVERHNPVPQWRR